MMNSYLIMISSPRVGSFNHRIIINQAFDEYKDVSWIEWDSKIRRHVADQSWYYGNHNSSHTKDHTKDHTKKTWISHAYSVKQKGGRLGKEVITLFGTYTTEDLEQIKAYILKIKASLPQVIQSTELLENLSKSAYAVSHELTQFDNELTHCFSSTHQDLVKQLLNKDEPQNIESNKKSSPILWIGPGILLVLFLGFFVLSKYQESQNILNQKVKQFTQEWDDKLRLESNTNTFDGLNEHFKALKKSCDSLKAEDHVLKKHLNDPCNTYRQSLEKKFKALLKDTVKSSKCQHLSNIKTHEYPSDLKPLDSYIEECKSNKKITELKFDLNSLKKERANLQHLQRFKEKMEAVCKTLVDLETPCRSMRHTLKQLINAELEDISKKTCNKIEGELKKSQKTLSSEDKEALKKSLDECKRREQFESALRQVKDLLQPKKLDSRSLINLNTIQTEWNESCKQCQHENLNQIGQSKKSGSSKKSLNNKHKELKNQCRKCKEFSPKLTDFWKLKIEKLLSSLKCKELEASTGQLDSYPKSSRPVKEYLKDCKRDKQLKILEDQTRGLLAASISRSNPSKLIRNLISGHYKIVNTCRNWPSSKNWECTEAKDEIIKELDRQRGHRISLFKERWDQKKIKTTTLDSLAGSIETLEKECKDLTDEGNKIDSIRNLKDQKYSTSSLCLEYKKYFTDQLKELKDLKRELEKVLNDKTLNAKNKRHVLHKYLKKTDKSCSKWNYSRDWVCIDAKDEIWQALSKQRDEKVERFEKDWNKNLEDISMMGTADIDKLLKSLKGKCDELGKDYTQLKKWKSELKRNDAKFKRHDEKCKEYESALKNEKVFRRKLSAIKDKLKGVGKEGHTADLAYLNELEELVQMCADVKSAQSTKHTKRNKIKRCDKLEQQFKKAWQNNVTKYITNDKCEYLKSVKKNLKDGEFKRDLNAVINSCFKKRPEKPKKKKAKRKNLMRRTHSGLQNVDVGSDEKYRSTKTTNKCAKSRGNCNHDRAERNTQRYQLKIKDITFDPKVTIEIECEKSKLDFKSEGSWREWRKKFCNISKDNPLTTNINISDFEIKFEIKQGTKTIYKSDQIDINNKGKPKKWDALTQEVEIGDDPLKITVLEIDFAGSSDHLADFELKYEKFKSGSTIKWPTDYEFTPTDKKNKYKRLLKVFELEIKPIPSSAH